MEVWFIRHGQSTANAHEKTHLQRIYLTDEGFKQAKEVKVSIDRKPELIVLSPFVRTLQTAYPTMEKYKDVPVEIWRIQEFVYLSPEKYDNTSDEQRFPVVQAYWEKNDPLYVDGKGAESFSGFIGRVKNCIEKLNSLKNKEFITVFGHGMFMNAFSLLMKKEYDGEDPDFMRKFMEYRRLNEIRNGEILKFTIEKEVCYSY